jgi:ribosomal 50S subunit-recycling heat shock protein
VSKGSLRLDRWLWFTRFYKTRTAASAAVQGGHVRVNGERARAATRVGVGDEIKLKRLQLEHELTVTGIPLRPVKQGRVMRSLLRVSRDAKHESRSCGVIACKCQ